MTPMGSCAAAALMGTYGSAVWDADEPSLVLTWFPVRFAPLGPIGRDVSVKAHVEELQMQSPLSGSQNGVEQLAGTACRGENQNVRKEGNCEGYTHDDDAAVGRREPVAAAVGSRAWVAPLGIHTTQSAKHARKSRKSKMRYHAKNLTSAS